MSLGWKELYTPHLLAGNTAQWIDTVSGHLQVPALGSGGRQALEVIKRLPLSHLKSHTSQPAHTRPHEPLHNHCHSTCTWYTLIAEQTSMASKMQLHAERQRRLTRARVQRNRQAEGDAQRHNTCTYTLPRFPRGSSCMPYAYALVTTCTCTTGLA